MTVVAIISRGSATIPSQVHPRCLTIRNKAVHAVRKFRHFRGWAELREEGSSLRIYGGRELGKLTKAEFIQI